MIFWIASYPKSGNTWCRAFIMNLLADGDAPVDINALNTIPSAASRELIDAALGIASCDLTLSEIDILRPQVYRHVAATAPKMTFMKIHDALTHAGDAPSPVPERATSGAIYIVRNPLDVAVSLAHHEGRPIDAVVKEMASDDYCIGRDPNSFYPLVRQRIGSWCAHVESWLDSPLDTCLVRYEDLLARPIESFLRITRFSGLSDEPERVKRAVRFSRFDELKAQEQEHGFTEKSPRSNRFFREGNAGGWKHVLTDAQFERIVGDHGRVMERLGYPVTVGATSP